jgi:hypothetical protein
MEQKKIKIEIDIVAPPEGYSIPERRPIYLPFVGILILIGECWVRPMDEKTFAGAWHICCHKVKT